VLQDPLINRGTAVTACERVELGLPGRLPAAVATSQQQANRAYVLLVVLALTAVPAARTSGTTLSHDPARPDHNNRRETLP
jgi:hypothetical protein